jgi:hypothetical protein
MEKITFAPNAPQQVALRFPDGKLTEGRFGDQMFYTTSNGKAMYLDLDVAQKLNLLGLRKNEPFWVCKRWSGVKGDPIQWDIWRLQPGEQLPSAATGIDPTALEADMTRQRQLQQQQPQQQQPQASLLPVPPQIPQPVYPGNGRPGASVGAPAPVATAVTQPPSNGNGSINGTNGHAPNGSNGDAKPYAAAGILAPPVKVGYDVVLRRILRTTIAALKDAGEQWSDAARQDLVSTLMIQAARDGAVSWAPLAREVN